MRPSWIDVISQLIIDLSEKGLRIDKMSATCYALFPLFHLAAPLERVQVDHLVVVHNGSRALGVRSLGHAQSAKPFDRKPLQWSNQLFRNPDHVSFHRHRCGVIQFHKRWIKSVCMCLNRTKHRLETIVGLYRSTRVLYEYGRYCENTNWCLYLLNIEKKDSTIDKRITSTLMTYE